MQPYEDLDAFKACHELALSVHPLVEGLRERDAELAGQLWQAALVSGSRIARGTAFENRRRFAFCLNCSVSALAEIGYYLNLADALGLIAPETVKRLEGLRARATFHVTKLIFSILEPPAGSSW
jgi:four helix bundle protein